MGKLRHGEAKWPAQERTWIRRPSQPANSRTWGGKGHNEKAVDLSRPGGGVGDGEGKPSRSPWSSRWSRGRLRPPAFCRSAPCWSPLLLLTAAAGGGGCSAPEGLFSRGPETTPAPRARTGRTQRTSQTLHFAHGKREAERSK